MALTQPMSPPSRQPFGVIDSSRLRFLQSAKNQQNGITSPSLKRRLETSDLSDTENIDPTIFDTPSAKRTRNSLGEDVSKAATTTSKFTFAPPKPIIATYPKRFQTPLSQIKKATLPNSAPLRAPAGRSPKSKPSKAFSRRSIGSYTRIDPPSFTKPHSAPRAPFSIADALHGTLNALSTSVPNIQSQSLTLTLQNSKTTTLDVNVDITSSSSNSKRHPKAWDFEIYADTEQDQMANLMEHSTCVLDISDDEDKPRHKNDRGKENIPPPPEFPGQRFMDGGEAVNPAALADGTSRNVEMTDEPRSVLRELDVAHFVSLSEEVDEGDDNNENEHEHEHENTPNTVDPTAIPLPPPTAQEDESQSQSQEDSEKPSESESETREIIPSSATRSQPPPSNENYHCHRYQHHHQQQEQQNLPAKPTLSSHAAISALISSAAPVANTTGATTTTNIAASPFGTGNEIEIWESGDAADGAEAVIKVASS